LLLFGTSKELQFVLPYSLIFGIKTSSIPIAVPPPVFDWYSFFCLTLFDVFRDDCGVPTLLLQVLRVLKIERTGERNNSGNTAERKNSGKISPVKEL
jgi:hypothetical protein